MFSPFFNRIPRVNFNTNSNNNTQAQNYPETTPVNELRKTPSNPGSRNGKTSNKTGRSNRVISRSGTDSDQARDRDSDTTNFSDPTMTVINVQQK